MSSLAGRLFEGPHKYEFGLSSILLDVKNVVRSALPQSSCKKKVLVGSLTDPSELNKEPPKPEYSDL